MHGEEDRKASRRQRGDLDEAAVEAALQTLLYRWAWLEPAWRRDAARLTGDPHRAIPREPLEAALRTYLERAGLG